MANEIHWRGIATVVTDYFTIRNASRQMWNTDTDGPAFETLTVANWYHAAASDANYWIALTESPAGSYLYVGTWPALLTTPGWYYVDIYRQAGASPAISDALVGTLYGYWNGTKYEPAGGDIFQVAGATQDIAKDSTIQSKADAAITANALLTANLGTVDTGFNVLQALKEILAKASGKIVKTGDGYAYYDKTNTLKFTLTEAGDTVTRS